MFYPGCDLRVRAVFIAERQRRQRARRRVVVLLAAVALLAGFFMWQQEGKAMPKLDHVVMDDAVYGELMEHVKKAEGGGVSRQDAIAGVLVAGLSAINGEPAPVVSKKGSKKGRK